MKSVLSHETVLQLFVLFPHIVNNIVDFQNSSAGLVYDYNNHKWDKHSFVWGEM